MKSISNHSTATLLLLSLAFCTSCESDKNNYPENYVGFEKSAYTHRYDKNNEEESIEVKIIAVNKEKTDRIVKLSASGTDIPGEVAYYRLENTQLTIKADSKSASTTVKINPKRAIRHSFLRIVCTPQWKDAKSSQLSILLEPK